jgi:toxin ParE1/3/4
MSARKRLDVVLSPDAQQDYDDILLYGLRNWGSDQASRYQERIDRVLNELGTFPEMGERRDELFPGCRFLPVERHVIFYEITTESIEIVRILHERANAARRLRGGTSQAHREYAESPCCHRQTLSGHGSLIQTAAPPAA